jgi:hypothetical protein
MRSQGRWKQYSSRSYSAKKNNKRVQLGMVKSMQRSSNKDVKKVPLHHSTPSSPKVTNPKDVVKKKKDNLDANKSFHSCGWEDFEDPFDVEFVSPFLGCKIRFCCIAHVRETVQ